jgi:hypothetical protein
LGFKEAGKFWRLGRSQNFGGQAGRKNCYVREFGIFWRLGSREARKDREDGKILSPVIN